MKIPLRRGRFFDQHDTPEKPTSVIVEENFAERFWPGQDPIGKHLWNDPKKPPYTIVGVVGVVKQYGLDIDGKIAVYFAQEQVADGHVFLVARTTPAIPRNFRVRWRGRSMRPIRM